jgi:hypothetical protein
LEGLPKNPRLIKDEKFEELKKSISSCKIMTSIREVVVYPFNENYIVIAGNQRFKAMEDLKFKTIPCKVLPEGTPIEVIREIAIKDNNHSGENDWDILEKEWDSKELEDWGVQVWEDPKIVEFKSKKENSDDLMWFLNIRLGSEAECSELFDELKERNLDVKIVN